MNQGWSHKFRTTLLCVLSKREKAASEGYNYGPYWRKEELSVGMRISKSKVLMGMAPRHIRRSPTPKVKAYGDKAAIEGNLFFYTKVPPDPDNAPSFYTWSATKARSQDVSIRDVGGNEFAVIEVYVALLDIRVEDVGVPDGIGERRSA